MDSTDYFHSEAPAGRSGPWLIEKITIPDREYDAAADPRPDCFKFRPGRYTVLRRESEQFMTDLYDEWWTQRPGIAEAVARGGDVLVTGLGLGLVAEAMLRPSESRVKSITIVELSPDVIRLVGPYLLSRHPGRIDLVEASAFAWEPPDRAHFSVAWHDIWPNPYAPEVTAEMRRLQERYGDWCDWQGFWPRTYFEAAVSKRRPFETVASGLEPVQASQKHAAESDVPRQHFDRRS
ncbi:MAG: hypothetical protein WBX15_05915 [Thermoanaerobaculia bacterium]